MTHYIVTVHRSNTYGYERLLYEATEDLLDRIWLIGMIAASHDTRVTVEPMEAIS